MGWENEDSSFFSRWVSKQRKSKQRWERERVDDWAPILSILFPGKLICQIFPVSNNDEAHVLDLKEGPPFEVNVPLYRTLLKDLNCMSIEACDNLSIKPRRGREWLGIWARWKVEMTEKKSLIMFSSSREGLLLFSMRSELIVEHFEEGNRKETRGMLRPV